MRTFRFLLVSCLVASAINGHSQPINAGVAGPGDLYADLNPDRTMCASMFNPNFPDYYMNADLDQDGTDDLTLHVWGGGILSGGQTSCTVNPLASHTSFITGYFTSMGFTVPVADTLNLGDPVTSANTFVQANCYLWEAHYGGATGPGVSEWNNIGEHYIGVRLALPRETLYGWIRVFVSAATPCLTVMDYACNKGAYTGIPRPVEAESPVLFPNPAGTDVRLNWNGNHPEASRLSVYSGSGELFFQAGCPSGQTTLNLDVSSWPAGLYLVKTETGSQVSTQRLVIIH